MSDPITITEALAELKTLGKRIEKKRQFVLSNLLRQECIKDPLEKEGGSIKAIERERQAIGDLEARAIAIRQAVADANEATKVTIGSTTRSIAGWLIWRREVAPGQQQFLANMQGHVQKVRRDAQQKGLTVGAQGEVTRPEDIVVHINETNLHQEIEEIEEILGVLDGQLSLKNATVTVNV